MIHTKLAQLRLILALVLLSGCATNTEGCQSLMGRQISVRPSEVRPDLVELYATKHQIYEDLKRRSITKNGLADCPVIYAGQNNSNANGRFAFDGKIGVEAGSNERAQDANEFQSMVEKLRVQRATDINNDTAIDNGSGTAATPPIDANQQNPVLHTIEESDAIYRITNIVEPDFYDIDLRYPTQQTAKLLTTVEGTVELKDGKVLERQSIEIEYFLANDLGGWRCTHAHATFKPDSKDERPNDGWVPRKGW